MNLVTARGYVRQFARNADDSTVVKDTDIDRAIQGACDWFLRSTRFTRATWSVHLDDDRKLFCHAGTGLNVYAVLYDAGGLAWNGSAWETYSAGNWTSYDVAMTETGTTGRYTASIPSGAAASIASYSVYIRAGGSPATTDDPVWSVSHYAYSIPTATVTEGFRPELMLEAVTSRGPVRVVGYDSLLEDRDASELSSLNYSPDRIAFDTDSTFEVYPPATTDLGRLYGTWTPPLTVWTPGTGSTVTLNLPDDILRTILMYGAPSLLQYTNPEQRHSSVGWQVFLTFCQKVAGGGHYAKRVFRRGELIED